MEPQRPIRYDQHVVTLGVGNIDGRCHARPQFEIGILRVDDGIVRYDVLNHLGSVSNLTHLALEFLPRKRIHRE